MELNCGKGVENPISLTRSPLKDFTNTPARFDESGGVLNKNSESSRNEEDLKKDSNLLLESTDKLSQSSVPSTSSRSVVDTDTTTDYESADEGHPTDLSLLSHNFEQIHLKSPTVSSETYHQSTENETTLYFSPVDESFTTVIERTLYRSVLDHSDSDETDVSTISSNQEKLQVNEFLNKSSSNQEGGDSFESHYNSETDKNPEIALDSTVESNNAKIIEGISSNESVESSRTTPITDVSTTLSNQEKLQVNEFLNKSSSNQEGGDCFESHYNSETDKNPEIALGSTVESNNAKIIEGISSNESVESSRTTTITDVSTTLSNQEKLQVNEFLNKSLSNQGGADSFESHYNSETDKNPEIALGSTVESNNAKIIEGISSNESVESSRTTPITDVSTTLSNQEKLQVNEFLNNSSSNRGEGDNFESSANAKTTEGVSSIESEESSRTIPVTDVSSTLSNQEKLQVIEVLNKSSSNRGEGDNFESSANAKTTEGVSSIESEESSRTIPVTDVSTTLSNQEKLQVIEVLNISSSNQRGEDSFESHYNSGTDKNPEVALDSPIESNNAKIIEEISSIESEESSRTIPVTDVSTTLSNQEKLQVIEVLNKSSSNQGEGDNFESSANAKTIEGISSIESEESSRTTHITDVSTTLSNQEKLQVNEFLNKSSSNQGEGDNFESSANAKTIEGISSIESEESSRITSFTDVSNTLSNQEKLQVNEFLNKSSSNQGEGDNFESSANAKTIEGISSIESEESSRITSITDVSNTLTNQEKLQVNEFLNNSSPNQGEGDNFESSANAKTIEGINPIVCVESNQVEGNSCGSHNSKTDKKPELDIDSNLEPNTYAKTDKTPEINLSSTIECNTNAKSVKSPEIALDSAVESNTDAKTDKSPEIAFDSTIESNTNAKTDKTPEITLDSSIESNSNSKTDETPDIALNFSTESNNYGKTIDGISPIECVKSTRTPITALSEVTISSPLYDLNKSFNGEQLLGLSSDSCLGDNQLEQINDSLDRNVDNSVFQKESLNKSVNDNRNTFSELCESVSKLNINNSSDSKVSNKFDNLNEINSSNSNSLTVLDNSEKCKDNSSSFVERSELINVKDTLIKDKNDDIVVNQREIENKSDVLKNQNIKINTTSPSLSSSPLLSSSERFCAETVKSLSFSSDSIDNVADTKTDKDLIEYFNKYDELSNVEEQNKSETDNLTKKDISSSLHETSIKLNSSFSSELLGSKVNSSFKDLTELIATCSKQERELADKVRVTFIDQKPEISELLPMTEDPHSQEVNQHMMQPPPSADINNSEAGPVTADEDFHKGEFFQDATSIDFSLTPARVAPSLTRKSLYVKFDPLIESALSSEASENQVREGLRSCFKAEMADTKIGDGDTEKTPKKDRSLKDTQTLIDINIPSGKTPEKVNNSSPSTPNNATAKRTLGSGGTPSLRQEVSKLQDLMLEQEQAYVEQLAEKNEMIGRLRGRVSELEALEPRGDMEQKLKAKEIEVAKLRKELNENILANKQLIIVMEEYEKTIVAAISKREDERNEFEKVKEKIAGERDTALQHLTNMEVAFNDIHLKYERCKAVIDTLHSNEKQLKKTFDEQTKLIEQQRQSYAILKQHAMEKINEANQEIASVHKNYQAEIAKKEAMSKKAELRVKSLEESLEQKKKEVKELTQICDELIGKVSGH